MTTAKDVFDIAMALMDEVNENSGATDTADTRAYRNRTLLILTALRGELFPRADSWTAAEPGKRPVCAPITDFETPLELDDVLAQTVMPYGLAAQLLLGEDAAGAAFLQQRYEELLSRYGRCIPAGSEDIADLYGGLEHGGFSRW